MNLVAADFLVCVLVLPFNIASGFAREFTIGSSDCGCCQACLSVVLLMLLLILVSLFTTSHMAVDRQIYLKKPLKYSEVVTIKKIYFNTNGIVDIFNYSAVFPSFEFGEIKFANEFVFSYCCWEKFCFHKQ